MNLNLSSYQVNKPYPAVTNVYKDEELAMKLKTGYSGEYSELTTVLQYAYHSLNCKQFQEVSQMMRGIFYVETLHMEFLGDCVKKLGGNAEYDLEVGDKRIGWQSALVDYKDTPAQMLRADIEGEKGAASFYIQMARTVKQPGIARLMSRLAEDEKLHQQMLTELYRKYF